MAGLSEADGLVLFGGANRSHPISFLLTSFSRHLQTPTHTQRRHPRFLEPLLIHPHLRLLHAVAPTLQPPGTPAASLDRPIMSSDPVAHGEGCRGEGFQGVEESEAAGGAVDYRAA